MTQISPIIPFNHPIFNTLKTIDFLQEFPQLNTAQADSAASFHPFSKLGAGGFIVLKAGQVIGYGSVEASPEAPLTAGIGVIKHCFIIPTERQKGYGTQLFKHLRQYAALHFGLLQVNKDCTLCNQVDGFIDLV